MLRDVAFLADMGGGSAFEVAGGTVIGTDHLAVGRPNQDAYAFRAEGRCLAAVVCDGCGSGARTEVGAALGARLVTEQVLGALRQGGDIESPETWEEVRRGTLAPLRAVAAGMGGRLRLLRHLPRCSSIVRSPTSTVRGRPAPKPLSPPPLHESRMALDLAPIRCRLHPAECSTPSFGALASTGRQADAASASW